MHTARALLIAGGWSQKRLQSDGVVANHENHRRRVAAQGNYGAKLL